MRIEALGVVAVSVVACACGWANDSALRACGGAVEMLSKEADVRMVSARITADIHRRDSNVRCRYRLRNEGRGQWVTIGFPDMPGSGDVSQPWKYHLTDFRSWVDGRRIGVTIRKDVTRDRRWFVRRVWFSRGQTRSLTDTYVQPHGHTGGTPWFPYIIYTARSWKGTIGRLALDVRWSEPYQWDRGEVYGLSQPRVADHGRHLSWRFHDIEPTGDKWRELHVSFHHGWHGARLNDRSVGWQTLIYPGTAMVPVRDTAYALGLSCDWRQGRVILSDRLGRKFVCRPGSRTGSTNGKNTRLRRRPVRWDTYGTADQSVYAPLRPICDTFGIDCSLDYRHRRVALRADELRGFRPRYEKDNR